MMDKCKFCTTKHTDWSPDSSHDFRIDKDALFYWDEMYGWEGTKINYCPMCGRKLNDGD